MKKPIQISIPAPCHENWEEMTPVEKGRFCGSCQKKVHDFTNMADHEIASILKTETNVCGNLTTRQIEQGLAARPQKSLLNIAAGAALLSLLTIGTNDAVAQEPVPTEQSPPVAIRGKVRVIEVQKTEGVVYDENNFPISGARISNTSSKKITVTDMEGKFVIPAQKGDKLEISYVGYSTGYITIEDPKTTVSHRLDVEEMVIGEVVYERTFFGHIFYEIGKMFK